ncbi:polysaccharide deacetylase family protein [Anaeromyxobacter sp. PSR-1]|uniref:polysaccharide deacetylase family protein n=1 Tax=Anaeromyxobacter sp. PSR-1 TaxID=1300915 RepID=UPI0005DF6FEC|nr:polysaccharide deacetylase family protein [Anaeromyxobacter sp. PSR-1]GAO04315.1 polysaccharide deacetylase [Anaeromyxobacter sp. PSR-1]
MPERADFSARWILKRAAKAAVAGALTAVGIHHAVRLVRRRQAGGSRVLILSYHRVTPDFGAESRQTLASLLVSTETLRRQLEHVGRRNEIVSLADARRILAEPAGGRRADVVAVTIDDGYADVAQHALPVLRALRAPATVFVPTGYVGTARRLPHDRLHAALAALARRRIPFERAGLPPPLQALLSACAEGGPAATLDRLIARLPHERLVALAAGLERRLGTAEQDLPASTRLMTWDEVRALDAAGVDVGGHTVNHAVLANLPLVEARRELAGCRDQLRERIGRAPRHFAYPNGYYTPAVQRAVAEAGFEAAVTIEDEENRHGGSPYGLKRKVLWENTTLGAVGWSGVVATCNLGGVFSTLGLARPVPGERPDPPAEPATRTARADAAEAPADARAVS